jgi:hypothetical protein
MNTEYKKSLEDEIDWKLIDQLHTATSTFSSTSLELKKLFFVLVGIAIPTLVKLAKDKLDFSLFITIYILGFSFWFLDSFTYYYQDKLRDKMDDVFSRIKQRNKDTIIIANSPNQNLEEFTIDADRTSETRVSRSIWNSSVKFYLIMIIINSVAIILFISGKIK